MNAEQFAAEQDQFDRLTHDAYASGRERTDDLLAEHPIAAMDGFVAHLGRTIAAEARVEDPARVFNIGEQTAEKYIEARAAGYSNFAAMTLALEKAVALATR